MNKDTRIKEVADIIFEAMQTDEPVEWLDIAMEIDAKYVQWEGRMNPNEAEEKLRKQIAGLTEDRFRKPAELAGLYWDSNFNYLLSKDILTLVKEAGYVKLPPDLEKVNMSEELELEVNRITIHKWQRVRNQGAIFNCDYWDCPNKIKDKDYYYVELYPEGHIHQFCESCAAFFLSQALNTLLEAGYPPVEEVKCAYCDKKPDAAMLTMGNSMAHDTCVIQKLNELLDYDYDGKGEPEKIVGYLPKFQPVKLEVLEDEELLDNEDRVFIDEITKRCSGSPWGTVHSEVQYTALHFKSKGRQATITHNEKKHGQLYKLVTKEEE